MKFKKARKKRTAYGLNTRQIYQIHFFFPDQLREEYNFLK